MHLMSALISLSALALAAAGTAKADTFSLNYEAPGVEHSTATFSVEGVETFNSLNPRQYNTAFVTEYGTNGAITGTYSGPNGLQINAADQYGGAGGTGSYPVAFASDPYSVTLVSNPIKDPQGINYFGYWLSALDAGNIVTFYKNGVEVGQLNPGNVTSAVSGNSAYFGNPNSQFAGRNSGQPYVFVNFYDTTGTFDKVTFTENPASGGYESDNHTVGFYTAVGGVPEPTTWAMLILGVLGLGVALRGRRTPLAA